MFVVVFLLYYKAHFLVLVGFAILVQGRLTRHRRAVQASDLLVVRVRLVVIVVVVIILTKTVRRRRSWSRRRRRLRDGLVIAQLLKLEPQAPFENENSFWGRKKLQERGSPSWWEIFRPLRDELSAMPSVWPCSSTGRRENEQVRKLSDRSQFHSGFCAYDSKRVPI